MEKYLKDKAEALGFGPVVEVLHHVDISHIGWECDNDAWIVRFKNRVKPVAITTNHGAVCIWSQQEMQKQLQAVQEQSKQIAHAFKLIGATT